jgi:ribonuclease BN (tRNA processing enzyme)
MPWAGCSPWARPRARTSCSITVTIREYLSGELISVGDCTLGMHGLRHVVANCRIRIRGGAATMAYIGDTGLADELLELARDADLLAEATLATTGTSDWGHLSATDAARVAASAGVGQLVLTHLGSADPQWANARKADAGRVFAGPVHLVRPGAHYRVGRP